MKQEVAAARYLHIFFLIAFLEEAFMRTIIIIQLYASMIIRLIMEDSKALFCASKFPEARKRISSKFIDNLGMSPQKVSPAMA